VNYEDYIGNLARLAVDVVNAGGTDSLAGTSLELFIEHDVTPPTAEEVASLLRHLAPAVAAVADGGSIDPVNRLLSSYPPRLHVSNHDGEGVAHLHHARNGEAGLTWLGRSCAAALAHVACGVPEIVIGRCQASDCARFFVDQSRNHSRRFCGNTCASRTTVAAHRARNR
jgi:hypothetical protein